MILIDKDIKDRCIKNRNQEDFTPLIQNFLPDKLGAVSYDLSIESILTGEQGGKASFNLNPGAFVYIRAKEKLNMPSDLIGRIEEKNSRMRMGLVVSGPTYQPGHKTAIFLRVQNISNNTIQLRKDTEIAQIVFEKLEGKPKKLYGGNPSDSFQNEFDYRGYGAYENEYNGDIQKLSKIKESIEDKETQIYANVLTFMGILMGIFSIITLNLEAFAQLQVTTNFILAMNLTIAFSIELLMSIILIFVNKNVTKKKIAMCVSILVVTFLLLMFVMFVMK